MLPHHIRRTAGRCRHRTEWSPAAGRRARERVCDGVVGKEFALFSITDGGCSCNLYSSGSTENRSAKRQRSLRQKYERLGWSTEKIERALSSSSDALEQRGGASAGGLRHDVAALFADLARRTERVKLIVNHFHGSFVDEPVSASSRVDLSVHELTERPEQIEANVVYTIRRSA